MTMAQVMILFYISSNNLKNQHGLTLLEMLVVVFILSAIALMTLSFTNNADDQFRFEDTRTRLEKIRTAAVGEPGRTVNGGPAVSGFVADMGQLPNDIRELIQPHPTDPNISCDGVGALRCWKPDPTIVDLWAGWRGPYISYLTEQSGSKTFRDGWGNAGAAPNYGWKTFLSTDTNADGLNDKLEVASLGSDGDSAAPEEKYAMDYPDTSGNPSADDLVVLDDHQINIALVKVRFHNPASVPPATLPPADVTLLVRLYYPQNGTITSADSAAVPLLQNSVADGSSVSVDFTFNKWVPWGVRGLEVINTATNTIYNPNVGLDKIRLVTLVPRTQAPFSTDSDPMEWWLE